jgi:hypothetical protein
MAFIGNQIITLNSLLDLDGQELVLDADADSTIHVSTDDQIDFKIGGTDVVTFTNSSSDFVITQAVQDKDIIFKGDDGGSAITALTLDMSDAGTAIFNHDITLNGKITGASQVTQDVNTSSFSIAGGTDSNVGANVTVFGGSHSSSAGVVRFRNGSTETARIDSSGNLGIGTTSPVSKIHVSGNLTIDNSSNAPFIDFVENGDTGDSKARISMDQVSGTAGQLLFSTENSGTLTEAMRIDDSGKVLLGTTQQRGHMTLQIEGDGSASTSQGSIFLRRGLSTSSIGGNTGADLGLIQFGDNDGGIYAKIEAKSDATAANNDYPGRLQFFTTADGASSPTERMRIDNGGNVLIGKTGQGLSSAGFEIAQSGQASATQDGGAGLRVNRLSDDGTLIQLRKDTSQIGSIGVVNSTDPFFTSATRGIRITGNNIRPCSSNGANLDNTIDLGDSGQRFVDIFATNGTIQTSDQNEKQDIASATVKELNVAKKLSTLFKTFRWKDKVTEKGDKARTHTGIIAQEVQTAFSAEGLDASNYGLFISDTWTNDDGKEQTRLGVRYPELFSFIFSSIEARLTALESK